MSTSVTGPGREDPLHPARTTAAARDDDIRRTRAELAETVAELTHRVNQLPIRARQAVRHGLTRPPTLLAGALVIVFLVLWWRRRH